MYYKCTFDNIPSMYTYQWTSAILGLLIAGTIILLIRRDHLHAHHAGWWLFSALCIAILGIFPKLVDSIAIKLNVNYPPTLLFSVGLGLILLKMLNIDIYHSRQERQLRRTIQRIALLEDEINRLKQDQEHSTNN